ncbi:RNA-guided endonuclease InsQ/TnpB family protein [Coleofasciculus chthonoplastes]|jgi:putative transposase|uniref:RNA-guided endonuclease InsQ/TnpB family protein n=1 Tax=Coleofasciculus chthonoplastes TaxID=64178 RepID=UPI0032FF1575
MLTRRVTFRLYPNNSQCDKLHWARKMHCDLYNAAIANRRTQYKHFGYSVDYFEQQNCLPEFKKVWVEYAELGSQTLQATLKRVDIAYQRFFKGLGKHPKFKAKRRYAGWTYPNKQSWRVSSNDKNGHLELRDLGETIHIRGKARTWGIPTTCTIFFRNGKWYASITVQCEPTRQTGTGSIGIDLGCKDAITFSTGEKIPKPDFIKEGHKKVKVASKRLRRKRPPNRNKKVKASRRWKKEWKRVSKLQRKVTRQREDWLHKTTSDIVSRNSLIAGEQLNVKKMTGKAKKGKRKLQKAGLNRSILDVGFGMIGDLLTYKAAEANGFYVESPTQKLKPTQRCAKCWELTPKTLADRVHVCSNPDCNHVEDRDVNAAQVNEIWARGQELSSLDAELPSPTAYGSMKQLGAKKRQKQRLQRSKSP